MSQSSKHHQRPQILRRSRVPSDSLFCSYSHRVCMQPRLDGFEYCSRHILEDKGSPFKQCQYNSTKTNKRCTSAAAKGDRKDGYCPDHARRAAHIRLFISRKRCPKETPESLLDDLDHYTGSRRPSSGSSDGKKSRGSELSGSKQSRIMDYASSSDSEVEGLAVENTWPGDGDSDAESVDSEQEDPLKHAGVYTAEEVALITRDKLIRLQSIYIDQFKRLQHVMKEKRRRFLHTVGKEHDLLGSIHYAKHDAEQHSKYEKLVAMKRYHKRYGQEALLHRQSKERRIAVSEGTNYRPPPYTKCVFSKGLGKCGSRTIPLSKYCFEHILHDQHQVLYQACNFGSSCKRPVARLFDNSACLYHSELEHIEQRLPHKKEEKDESKDEIDVVGETDVKMDSEPHQSIQLQRKLLEQLDHVDGNRAIKRERSGSDSKEHPEKSTISSTDVKIHSQTAPLASSQKNDPSKTGSNNVIRAASIADNKPVGLPNLLTPTGRSNEQSRGKNGQKSGSRSVSGRALEATKMSGERLRPIAPTPTPPANGSSAHQTSPSKSPQVPLVVNDLLEEEKDSMNENSALTTGQSQLSGSLQRDEIAIVTPPIPRKDHSSGSHGDVDAPHNRVTSGGVATSPIKSNRVRKDTPTEHRALSGSSQSGSKADDGRKDRVEEKMETG